MQLDDSIPCASTEGASKNNIENWKVELVEYYMIINVEEKRDNGNTTRKNKKLNDTIAKANNIYNSPKLIYLTKKRLRRRLRQTFTRCCLYHHLCMELRNKKLGEKMDTAIEMRFNGRTCQQNLHNREKRT